jgi:hypothetical protein
LTEFFNPHQPIEDTGMPDKKENNKHTKARRELLKATVIGSGAVIAGKSLPESWSRPVVDSVMLPAHAQTSATGVGGAVILSLLVVDADDSILDSLVPAAHAQEPSIVTAELCFMLNDNGTIAVRALVDNVDDCAHDIAYFTGTVNQGVETALSLQNGPCLVPGTAARVAVTMAGGVANGDFVYSTLAPEFSSPFNFSDPTCPIGAIPAQCDQGTCDQVV